MSLFKFEGLKKELITILELSVVNMDGYTYYFIKDEDGNLIEDLDSVLTKGVVFDQKMDEEGYDPAEFEVSGVVDGWATALQHMHVGDRWEVWIPYQLGYGVTGSSGGSVTILPYSTLVFDMEVAEITEQ